MDTVLVKVGSRMAGGEALLYADRIVYRRFFSSVTVPLSALDGLQRQFPNMYVVAGLQRLKVGGVAGRDFERFSAEVYRLKAEKA